MYGIDFVKKLKRRNIGGSKRSSEKLFGRTVILGPTAATSTLRRRISCRNSNRTENFPQAESRSSAAGCPTFRKARKTPPMSSAARKSGSSVPRTRLAERLPGPLSSGGTARAIAVRRPFGVGRPVDDSAQLAPETCPGTHHARLDGHIELAFGQILSPDGRGGGRDSLHFGMSRSVRQRLDQIMSSTDDAAVPYDDRSDRDLALLERLPRFG